MTRLHKLPQNQVAAHLAMLKGNHNDLKSGVAQPLGSTSFRTHLIQSGLAYDIQCTGVTNNNTVVLVTFTPTDSANGVLGLVYRFYMQYVDSTGTSYLADSRLANIQRQVPSGSTQEWYIYLQGSNSSPIAWVDLTFYFFASGSGTFTSVLV